jgi:hypothetical protein
MIFSVGTHSWLSALLAVDSGTDDDDDTISRFPFFAVLYSY